MYGPAGLSGYPLFMQRQWFQPEVAGALRGHIRNLILELFISQASTVLRVALMKLPLNTSYSTTDAHGRRCGGMEAQAASCSSRARSCPMRFAFSTVKP